MIVARSDLLRPMRQMSLWPSMANDPPSANASEQKTLDRWVEFEDGRKDYVVKHT